MYAHFFTKTVTKSHMLCDFVTVFLFIYLYNVDNIKKKEGIELNIYRCKSCGNILVEAVNGGGPLTCCGTEMTPLKAGITDAAQEKHVPVYKLEGNSLNVNVGGVTHPMERDHYIQLILVQQENTVQYRTLNPGEAPQATFDIDPLKPFTVYEYCNLHGLWKV